MANKNVDEPIEYLREYKQRDEPAKEKRLSYSRRCFYEGHIFKYDRHINRSYCLHCGAIKRGW